MDNAEILDPLLNKGDIKATIEFAQQDKKDLFDVRAEGLNIVSASILADIPSIHKMELIRQVGALFPSDEYCELLNQKIFTIAPEKRARLKDQGVVLNSETSIQYSEWFNVFEVAFPWLPLSIFEDFAQYLYDDKHLGLDKETVELVYNNFLKSKRYSERALEQLFESDIFKN